MCFAQTKFPLIEYIPSHFDLFLYSKIYILVNYAWQLMICEELVNEKRLLHRPRISVVKSDESPQPLIVKMCLMSFSINDRN